MNSTNAPDNQPPALHADRMGDDTLGDALRELVKSLAEQVSVSRLPPPEPSVFYGDPMRYLSWKIAFQTLIEHRRIPAGERLHYLKKYMGGQVKDTVESYFLLPPEDAFEERYGNQFVIADAFRDKLENWQRINPRDGTALQKCYILIFGPSKMPFKVMHRKEVTHSNGSYVRKSRGRKLADEMGRAKKFPWYTHRLMHRKRVTCELHDSYFRLMTINIRFQRSSGRRTII